MLSKIPVDTKVSTKEAIINKIIIINENIVCLSISNFMLSTFLSFTIDLYNLNPLTAIAIIAGIKIKFCKTNVIITNNRPFDNPITVIHVDIVYPKQNPLYKTIPKTTGIPITVVPKNQIATPKTTFCAILVFNNCKLFTSDEFFRFVINVFIYLINIK